MIQVAGVQEDVQLREQDWGNFQEAELQAMRYAERLAYGRFFYRFPDGESAADVYDRLTMSQDHFVRDLYCNR
jgi:broad specificity phosphatase PhoE